MANFKTLLIEKCQAFGAHLAISAAIFSLVMGGMLLACYPPPYYRIDGLWDGLRITLAVDLILGPLVTLVIYKKSKPGLKLDLACVALVQLTALAYGAITVYLQRPYFVVFAEDKFQTVRWVDIAHRGRPADQLQALHQAAPGTPPRIAVRPPINSAEITSMVAEVFSSENGDFAKLAQRYMLIDAQVWPQIAATALSASQLNAAQKKAVNNFCQKQKLTPETIAVFPLSGRFADGALIAFDKTTGQFLGYPD